MNIASVFNTVTQAVDQALPLAPGGASTTQGASSSVKDSASVSPSSQMLNQLQQLQTANPPEFKQVMTAVSDKLTAAAKATSDPQAQQALEDLASKFQSAAAAGTVAPLQPSGRGGSAASTGGPPAGGGKAGPPGGGAPAGSSGSTSKIHDAADTNYDGKVSAQEARVYAAKQAEAARQREATSLAKASGTVEAELATARSSS